MLLLLSLVLFFARADWRHVAVGGRRARLPLLPSMFNQIIMTVAVGVFVCVCVGGRGGPSRRKERQIGGGTR